MESIFDHEKLDVYGLELRFVAWTTDFIRVPQHEFPPATTRWKNVVAQSSHPAVRAQARAGGINHFATAFS
jgi:hypothetical protein